MVRMGDKRKNQNGGGIKNEDYDNGGDGDDVSIKAIFEK